MRLTWSAMLQHNNNNNYPCLKASSPLKCSSASRPLPGRLQPGLADLPLIRGLRAWALCSKSRHKGGGQAPATPPTARRTCRPGPADVNSSGAWASGYGLPRAAVGALVTVATLKTSQGNGKTQTQCLFPRNDKGTCLSSASGGAGGWLRGKSGTGTGRRDNVCAFQTAASRVRVRSGRRWRKSTHPVAREKSEKVEKQGKAGRHRLASPKEEACQERGGPRGSTDCLQNSSNLSRTDSQGSKTLPDGKVKVRPDCVVTTEGEACHKSRGPRGSPGFHHKSSNEERQSASSHAASPDKRLPEEEVAEKQEEPHRAEPQYVTGPDRGVRPKSCGPCGSPGCLQNASTRRRSAHVAGRDKRLPDENVTDKRSADEEVTQKQEEPDKVSPEGLAQEILQNLSKEERARKEGTLSGKITETKREREENAQEGKSLCQNEASILSGPNPDLQSSHSYSERKGAKHSIKTRPNVEERTIQSPFDDITATGRCIGDSGRAEGEAGSSNNVTRESVSRKNFTVDSVEGKEADCMPNDFARGCMLTPAGPCPHNPTPAQPTSGTVATSQPRAEAEEGEKRGQDGIELESRVEKQEEEKEDEEDDFGGFVQAEGGEECGRGVAVSVPVPCGNAAAFGSGDVSGEWCDWKPAWMGRADAWAAFPQDVRDDVVGQWWPDEERTDVVHRGLDLLFAAAFPSLPTSAPRHPADIIPTLTQLLGGSSNQEQRLLDSFHDMSKMSVHKYKRGSSGVGVSRDLLLSSLHVEQPNSESRAANRWSNRRPSPGLHSPNRYAQNVVAKRRLSCDFNRSGPE